MSRQFDLFGTNYPEEPGFMKESPTSRAAAESMMISAASLRGLVLAYIGKTSGLTCDEVEVGLGLRHQTASARITELKLAGRIRSIGRRPTRSGRYAEVWIAVRV